MDADWDLQAVVRGCCSSVSTSLATTTTTPSWPENSYLQQKSTFYEDNLGFFPDLFQPRTDNSIEHFLNDLYNPFYFHNIKKPPPSSQNLPISPLSVLGGLQDPPYYHHSQHNHHNQPQQKQQQQQQQEKQFHGKQQSLNMSRCTTSNAQSTTKFKKRKNQVKKICQVPAEGSPPSSDLWSWRKYGQKPIKGSPYPRGYYKCSTSKGCLARKQVERNRSDAGMLIITYTGEHSHPMPAQRNSLAGSSRNKATTSTAEHNINKPTPSSPLSPVATLSPAMEKIDEFDFDRDYIDDDNLDVSSIVIDEDIFDGLDDFVGPAT